MNKNLIYKLSVLSIVFVPLTVTFSKFIFPKFYMSFALTVLGILILVYPVKSRLSIVRKSNASIGLLMIACFLVQLINNQALKNGDYQYTVYFLSFVLGFFILIKTDEWIPFIIKFSQVLAMIYTGFTIFFYYNENLYRTFVMWAYPSQSGVIFMNYARGYMTGVFDNYSACGIWMALSVGFSFTCWLKSNSSINKKIYLLCTVLSAVALLLTAKRGVTLYAACALIIIYFIWNIDSPISGFMKMIFIVIISLTLFRIFLSYIPDLANVFERFSEFFEGGDAAVGGRIVMREKAMELFKTSPLFGIGWRGFLYGRYFSDGDVHNTFAQLLCETGIFGFVIFCSFVFLSLLKTIKLLCFTIIKGYKETAVPSYLAFSLFIQLIVVMYFASGNPLYDLSLFCPYFIGIWILGYYQEKYW